MGRFKNLITAVFAATVAAFGLLGLGTGPSLATPGAVIDNGVVQLGVHQEGHLNIPSDNTSSGGADSLGLRFKPTNADATAPGCRCEGWGAADALTGVSGYANESADGGTVNIALVSFESTASTATSVVDIGDTLRVTHAYRPSPATPHLFEALVTITNRSAATVDARYRRVMDWDIEPTAFSEYVTTHVGTATALLDNDNDGFASANPLSPDGTINPIFNGAFTDEGPQDHGARFDFGFAGLAPSASVQFKVFYGAAPDEPTALAALANVRAEVYSLGQPSTSDGPTRGEPNTFVFAFANVGGDPVTPGGGLPAGAFGRWPRNPGAFSVYFDYVGEQRYLGNMVQAANNWNEAGAALTVRRWPGVPAALHLVVRDISVGNEWFGLAAAAGSCAPATGTSCVFTRNTIFLNRDLLDGRDDAFRTKTTTHELGHALGLCHQTGGDCGINIGRATRSIMQPGSILLDAPYNTVQEHDADLLRRLYP